MGSWDCYCAICGSALCGVQIARHPRSARFKRRQRRQQQNRENREKIARGEQNVPSDVPSSDDEGHELEREEGEGEASEDMDAYEEDQSYDMDILGEGDVEWTNRCWILGWHAGAKGVKKTFIAGPGHYDDYGNVNIANDAMNDPNYPDDDFLSCYGTFDADRDPVFPFHWCCYELLLKCITGKTDFSSIDQDAMYNAMRDVAPEYGCSLLVDYGNPAPAQDQFWQSTPGEELLVVNPTIIPNFGDLVRSLITNNDFKSRVIKQSVVSRSRRSGLLDGNLDFPIRPVVESPDTIQDYLTVEQHTTEKYGSAPAPEAFDALAEKVRRDDFAKLPYDILYKLAELLPTSSIFALANASWSVNAKLRQNEMFWKHLIRRSTPWFFELHSLLDDPAIMKGKDFRGLLLWLEKMTAPRLGMNGPFMGVANRRRIWGVCEQLKDRYLRKLAQQQTPSVVDDVASSIMEHAENPLLPIVSFPPTTENLASHSTQWIRTWDEIHDQVWRVETFWSIEGRPGYDASKNEDAGFLVGIALTSSRERRLFGKDTTAKRVMKMETDVLLNDFVAGFVLHLPDMDMRRNPIHRTVREGIHPPTFMSTGIRAVTVLYRSGDPRVLAPNGLEPEGEHLSQRALLVSPGKTMVGMMGSIASDGTIKRLGILQCRRPPLDDFNYLQDEEIAESLPSAQKRLWKRNMIEYLGAPIWNHPSLRFVTPTNSQYHTANSDFSTDVIPHEVLVWASPINGADDFKIIKRISAFVTVGGQVTDGRETRDYHDICGLRVEYTKESNYRKRFIGRERQAVPGSEDPRDEDWDEENMLHLDIDGPGGEVVTSIEVAMHEAPKAVKIRTNKGQEVYWGEQKVGNWSELRAPEGETMIGLAMAFGIQSGWSWDTQTHNHMKMSWVSVLSMPLGGVS